jgi:NAD(P)-dependent dehydrogenase (short-subunit alcohol dehydrogenase family)
MTDTQQIRAAIEAAGQEFDGLDILVNNAGIAPGSPAASFPIEDFDATVAVNLRGTFFACQAALPLLRRRGAGRIINIGSQAGAVALPGESVYCMTKAAIAHLSRCLAVEWGPYGITVNTVAPTFIETPGTEQALSDPEFRADVIERIAALHRIGQPCDVTGAVVFLASPAAALVTGATIAVDGGWTAR